jgi:hypothetical protein
LRGFRPPAQATRRLLDRCRTFAPSNATSARISGQRRHTASAGVGSRRVPSQPPTTAQVTGRTSASSAATAPEPAPTASPAPTTVSAPATAPPTTAPPRSHGSAHHPRHSGPPRRRTWCRGRRDRSKRSGSSDQNLPEGGAEPGQVALTLRLCVTNRRSPG